MDMNIIERLRNQLQPLGTAPVVQLRVGGHGLVNSDFINKCIDELERMPIRAALGDMPNNLEKLAYMLLCDSAYIDPAAEREVLKFTQQQNANAKNA